MKKVVLFLLIISITCFGSSCKNKELTANDNKYKIALVCNISYLEPDAVGTEIYNDIESFYSETKKPSRKFHPQSDERLHIISAVESAIGDGYNVISVIGNVYGNAISSIAAEYPHITFIIFGMSDAIALHTNVYCSNLDVNYLEFFNNILK